MAASRTRGRSSAGSSNSTSAPKLRANCRTSASASNADLFIDGKHPHGGVAHAGAQFGRFEQFHVGAEAESELQDLRLGVEC